REWEVQRSDGRWFRLSIRPYRTTDNRLDGAVLSFLDVDGLKRALQTAERARDYAQQIVETVPTALVVLDGNLRVVSSNPPFRKALGAAEATEGAALLDGAGGAWDVPALRDAVERSLAADTPFHALEIDIAVPQAAKRSFLVAGCPLHGSDGEPLVLL